MALIANSAFGAPSTTNAADNEDTSSTTAGDYNLSVSATANVDLDISVSDNDTMTVSQGYVSVITNSPGYRLYISMMGDTTSLASGDIAASTIAATSGTIADPEVLTRGTWGYAIPSGTAHLVSNKFSDSYSATTSTTPDNSKKFAVPPVASDNPDLLASSTSSTAGDTYPIFYGVRANAETNPGAYEGVAVFTAVADAAATDDLILTPDNTSIDTATTVTVQTPLYTTASYADADIYFLTEEQHNALVSGTLTLPDPLSCTKVTGTPLTYNCSVPAQSKIGTYYIYANVPRYDISYDAPFEVTNMVTLTVNPNGGTWSGQSTSQQFTQNEGTTKNIADPTGPALTITYDANGQGASYSPTPSSVTKAFTSWTPAGGGTYANGVYTFGATSGSLTAAYAATATITLPAITKTNYSCSWAEGTASGTKHAGGESVAISANTTFVAVCSINPMLTINPNGGTWGGKTTSQDFYQVQGTTKSIVDPENPTYTITWNDNGQGASYTGTPTSITPTFSSWTLSGSGTWNAVSKLYTFGSANGTMTATYTNNTITLPSVTKTNYTCKWAEGSASGTQYEAGTTRPISANTSYYAVCTINPKLTVNPNGGTWNSSSASQDFYQVAGTTKSIADPTAPSWTISYDMNDTGITKPTSPTSATRTFTSWNLSGGGSFTSSTYTFGSTDGTLTAAYNNTPTITLPSLNKTGHDCQWAAGSTTGTKYNSGATNVPISADTTFYAVCTIKSYTLTINADGGTYTPATVTQNYNTTYTLGNPTSTPSYTISYDMGSTGITKPSSPTSASRSFTSWSKSSGEGTLSGSTWTFGAGNGAVIANYGNGSITLPALSKTGHDCQWAAGSTTGTKYNSGATNVPISADTTFYAVCTIKSYTLTINANGGTYTPATVTQNYNTTYTLGNPTSTPSYTISYDMGSTGITKPTSPTSASRSFTSWTKSSGEGSLSGSTWTFGAGNGAVKANYGDGSITLPTLSKTGHDCQWAAGSTTGTKYNSGATNVPISADTTFYAVCTIKSYTLTINANGGTYTPATVTQNYNTTYTLGNPTSTPSYTISYDMGSTGITKPSSPTSASRSFTSWSKSSGEGTLSGSTWTFGAGNGAVKANYATTSNSFSLPAISKTNYACKWAEGTASGTQYAGGASRTISANTIYYAVCTYNPLLTVNPNGGTWSGSTSSQTFRAAPNSTKSIDDPSANATYTISYNANSQGASYTGSPTSVTRNFSSWSKSGGGSFSSGTYTYGTTDGTLTASYNTTSNSFTLPSISKAGHTCKWAEGSTSGTQYEGGTSRTLTDNTTYYATCTPNNYTVTITNSNTTSGSASISVPYGGSNTVTVTPASGYYLSNVECPEGYTCSGYTTGTSATGQQTVTITNNNTQAGGTLGFAGTLAETLAQTCDKASVGSTFTYSGVEYIKLNTASSSTSGVDGSACYTKTSQGYGTWANTASLCPANTGVPTQAEFQSLINAYGSGGTIRNTTGWDGGYWSSTERPDYTSFAYFLYVESSNASISNRNKYSSNNVVCVVEEYMQDMTPAIAASMSIGESKTLTDTRDNNAYTVAKLNDGNVWMTQNLALGSNTNDTVLTPADSNVSANFTIQASAVQTSGTTAWDATSVHVYIQSGSDSTNSAPYGNLYNWYTATAGTGTSDMVSASSKNLTNATADICPKGWRLPDGGQSTAKSFNQLDIDLNSGIGGNNRTDATSRDRFRVSPYLFPYSGLYDGGPDGQESLGYWWSRSAYTSSSSAYQFTLGSRGYVYPQDYNSKRYGFSVRCVAK